MTPYVVSMYGFCALVLIAGAGLHLFTGTADLSAAEVARALMEPETFAGSIVWYLRLPRVLFAIVIGAGLSVCGLVLQGLFRNPLAEPFTLGISSGAGFGAVVAMSLGVATGLGIGFAAFLGALLVTVLVFLLVRNTLFSQTSLILCGVMIGYLFQALLMLILALSTSEQVQGALMWLLGDLSSTTREMLVITSIACLAGSILLFRQTEALDRISLGEEKAQSLGIDIAALRRWVFLCSSLVTGLCVASVGVIGFVGLMIPHVARYLIGPGHTRLFWFCAMGGAAFLLYSDWLAKTLAAPIELPIGVITGIIGSLSFLWIFIRRGASA